MSRGALDGEGVGHLYVIYLDLDRRGVGIGSRLLDFVSDQQRALGATEQQVAVLEGNEHGLPFYRVRGFSQIHRHLYPAHDPSGAPELLLERSL